VKPLRNKVVFIDRDGVINHDSPDYIKTWDEFGFIDGSLAAIRRLTENHFTTIVITNQSAINRKLTSMDALENIHTRLKAAAVSHGGYIENIFFCPHTPEERCPCRKPAPGLIFKAQKVYDIDLSSAYMVGDSAKDIECARNAACGHAVLVQTGNGISAQKALARKNIYPDLVAANLFEAANWILTHDKTRRPAYHP
jgi:D-glycero-D-manno-heptose 1,7-bisphosphate phosphatase